MPVLEDAVKMFADMVGYLYTNLAGLYRGICDIDQVRSGLASASSVFRMKVIVKETIDSMYDRVQEMNKKDHSSYIVNYLINAVKNSYYGKISLNSLANELGMNYNYISGQFTKKAGLTFCVYLMNYRLEKARELLKDGKFNINEISGKCGFYDSKYFCKAFKKRYGITPGEFKNM